MARIESKQVVAPKIFDPLRVELDATIKKTQLLSDALQKQLDLQVKISQGVKNSATGYKQLAEAETKSKNALTQKEKIDKRALVLQEKLTQVTKVQRERLAALSVEEQRRNKNAKQSAALMNQNIGAFERLNVKIKQLSDQYRNLIVVEGRETKQSRALRIEILKLNATRNMANESLGIHAAKVGNYTKVVDRLKTSLGRLGLTMGVFMLLRNVFGIVKNFDQATADLASVLGVTTDQMAALTEQSKQLGATTIFTASEVAELQKEYAKLGFTQEEILGVTDATLQLAAATGSELGTAAEVVGSNLRAFGLDVSETQRVVDVMAKSFSSSSLDMEKFTVAMRAVAPVAKNAGYTIEETTALLGTLTDRGVDASTAGTGLRNVFLELSKKGLTFDEAMNKINNSTDKNKTSLELFGKRGAVIGSILAETGADALALTHQLNNAGGAAEKMADTQLDTLGGAVKLLVSAWEGWILKMNEAGGAGESLKNIIKFLAENLDWILDTIILVTKAWIGYKLAIKTATLANKAFGKSALENSKKFGAWGIAIALLVQLTIELYGAFTRLTVSQQRMADASEEAAKQVDQEKIKMTALGEALNKTTTASEERQFVLDKINAEYGTTLQNLADEAEFLGQIEEAYKSIVKQMEKKALGEALSQQLTEALGDVAELSRKYKDGVWFGSVDEAKKLKESKQAVIDIKGELVKLNYEAVNIVGGRGPISQLKDRFKDADKEVKKVTSSVKELNKTISEFDIENYTKDFNFDEGMDNIDYSVKQTEDISYDSTDATNKALREIERLDLAEKELWSRIRSEISETTNMITDMYETRLKLIDREIDAKQKDFDDSKAREEQLRELAKEKNLDASESIQIERELQKAALKDQQDLARKKQKIEALIVGLRALAAKIEAGEGNPVQNVKSDILNLKNFIEGAFYEGTPYTVADALGGNGVKDGHIVRIDDKEAVLNPEQTRALNIRKGGNSTDDIVNIYKKGLERNNSSLKNKQSVKLINNEDGILAKKVDQLIQVTKQQANPGKMTFNSVIGAFQWQKDKKTYTYPIRKK